MNGAALTLLVVLVALTTQWASAAEPGPPTNLIAQDISPTSVELTWEAPDSDGGNAITGYRIEASDVSDDYSVVDTVDADTTSYTHEDLTTDSIYLYKVYAINPDGESDAAKDGAVPTESSTPPKNIVPPAPTGLVATDISPTRINLEWIEPESDNYPVITGYRIEHKVDSSLFKVLVNNTEDDATKYTAIELKTDSEHTFRISALNSVGFGDPSNEAAATPTADSTPGEDSVEPNKPRGLSTTPVSPTEIIIKWDEPRPNNSPEVTSYQIEVRINSGEFEIIESSVAASPYRHTGLNTDDTYTYRVLARNSVGLSSPSSTASGQAEHSQVPTQLAVFEISPTQARLSWNAPSQTYGQRILGYDIREKLAPDTYDTIDSTDDTTHTISDLTTGKEYTYVVLARFELGSTDISEEVTFTLTEESGKDSGDPPGKPINLQAEGISPIQINLTWDAPVNDGGSPITGYRIDLKINDGDYTTIVENTKNTKRVYFHTDRVPDTEYKYRVYAINEVGTSPASNVASETTTDSSGAPAGEIPSPPRNLSAEAASTERIVLSWDTPTDNGGSKITGYTIESKRDSGDYTVISNAGTVGTYMHSNLPQNNATYTYRVYSVNDVGQSEPSNLATAKIVIIPEDPKLRIPGFPSPDVSAQRYIDRYDEDSEFREWFDSEFPEYTIRDLVGEPTPEIADPPEEIPDPPKMSITQYYLDRYNSEPAYKEWFDEYFEGERFSDVVDDNPPTGVCGEGTELKDGICQIKIE